MDLSPVSLEQAISALRRAPKAGPALVVTPNLNHLRLLRLPSFRAAYEWATLTLADGFPVWAYARMLGARNLDRVTGCDLCKQVMHDRFLRTSGLFFVVESEATAVALRRWAQANDARVGTYVAPPAFADNAQAQAAAAGAARAFAPAVLLITLGAPTSEVFVHCHRSDLPACWAICVGQAVRVALGETARAPVPLRAAGLEWLWRIASEPRRLSGRYARDAAWFPLLVARDFWRRHGRLT